MSVHDWDREFKRVYEQERASYSGMMLPQLQATVDTVLAVYKPLPDENTKVCLTCGRTLGEHSHIGWHCPNSELNGPLHLESRFDDGYTIMDKIRDEAVND